MAYKFSTFSGLVGFGAAPIPPPVPVFSIPRFETATAASPSTTVVVNVPEGIQDGDLLIACSCSYNSSNATTQASFSLIQARFNSNLASELWWREASSEPSSYTFSNVDITNNICVTLVWIPLSASGTPHKHAQAFSSSNVPTATCPTVTTTINDCMLLTFVMIRAFTGGASTPPDGHTTNGAINVGTTVRMDAGYELLSGQGVTGTRVWTKTDTNRHNAFTVAVAPE